MSKVNASYYRRREAQELKAAAMASDPEIGRLHWELARRYAYLAAQPPKQVADVPEATTH